MDVPTTLFDQLALATEPLTATRLARMLPGKAVPKMVEKALGELADQGRVRAFTAGKTTVYAARSPLDLCAESLALQLPLVKQATPPARLKVLLPKSLHPWFDEALGRLVVQGRAYWLPKGKVRLVLPRPVQPSDLLSGTALNQLKKLLGDANRHRRAPRHIEDLLAWLDAESNASTAAKPTAEPVALLTTDLLHEWYQADAAKSSTSMIPIPQTWKHYATWAAKHHVKPDPAVVRSALEALYNEGAAMLEPHERPQSLPEEERRLQVSMALGPPGYYWKPMP